MENNHKLPEKVTITGTNLGGVIKTTEISLPAFLKLITTVIQKIDDNDPTSTELLEIYGNPTGPSETITTGNIPLNTYVEDIAGKIQRYMDRNLIAPNYSSSSGLGTHLRYENLIYIFSEILNSYKTNGVLPDLIAVNKWIVVTQINNNFSMIQISDSANFIKSYIETHHKLPSSITISGTQVSMPQFLKLAAITLLNNDSEYGFILNYGSATNPSETMRSGILNSTEYTNIANKINAFMDSNGCAPNYIVSSEGNIRYESLVYICSEILYSCNINGVMPSCITIDPWSIISKTNTVFFSSDQVTNASSTVKAYVETYHKLPSSVTISGTQVSIPPFLELIATTTLNIASNFDASAVLQSYGISPYPFVETISKSKNIDLEESVKVSCNIRTFMNDPNYRYAPAFAYTSLGEMRYESLVYTYSKILDFYNSTGYLPDNITFNPWTVISNKNTVFFTPDQINIAASTVKAYLETNHQLPATVTVSGSQVSMSQFLQLATEELLNIYGNLCPSFILTALNGPSNPIDDINAGNINETEYQKIASDVRNCIYNYSHAPDYACQTSLGTHLGFQNLVYMYAQILNSYKINNETLPNYITVNPWSVVSNSSTVFLSMDQIINASGIVQSYITLNNALPSSVVISGTQVYMPQFLELATATLLNIEGYLDTSIVLGNIANPTNTTEDIVSGDIPYYEYIVIANDAKDYMDTNGTAPGYTRLTSLGDHMRFQSLVNIYSEILQSYHTNNKTLPDYITITPWIAISNPNKIYNYRSNEVFNTIQDAINDNNTINGDTIGLGIGTILENVIVDKSLFIMSIPTVNVTVRAADINLPVFTITSTGIGSTIQDLNIKGATNNAGICLNNSFYNIISNSIISGNKYGIFLDNSTNNWISDTSILNNTFNGIFVTNGSDNNTIIGDIVSNNLYGINILNSYNNTISNNIISNNSVDGIYLNNSSAQINFNRIVGNTRYGLYNTGNGTVNAENNWWGSNTLNSTSVCVNGGTVNIDQWLVLNVTSSCDRSNRNGTTYNYIITADLTHNNLGVDTSSGNGPSNGNTLPDGIPLNFSTTLGTINTPVSTRNGKAVAIVNSTVAGWANVTVNLDNLTITVPVNVTSINVLGIFNNRTDEGFTSIQDAINSNNTLDGDIITLADGIYTENVVVYKTLTIKPVSGADVTVQAANPYYGVFTVMNDGSAIQNLKIVGAMNSYGILGYANNLQIIGNTIMANKNAITLFNSKFTTITGNTITSNEYGTVLYNSTNTTITNNIITDNWYATTLYNSTSIIVSENNITSNWYGIFSNILNNSTISENNITSNSVGMQFYYSNCTISENNVTGNDEGIIYHDSNCITSGNNVTGNWIADALTMDTTSVVMQNKIWNCGPASLATVLNRLGVNATQDDIATLAGTDQTGTSMAGLVYAANVKGLTQCITATGMIITNVTRLQPNNIVLFNTVSGLYHYCVITNITNTHVFLADSMLGNINMTIGNFTAVYTGYVIVVTNDTNNSQFNNGTFLNDDTMSTIIGTNAYAQAQALFGQVVRSTSVLICIPVVNVLVVGAWLGFGTGIIVGCYYWPKYLNAKYGRNVPMTVSESAFGTGSNNRRGYGSSYSYGSHGHSTRYQPPIYTPPPVYPYSYYKIAADGSYALVKGTTTGNPDEIKNQKIKDLYNKKKALQLAKIAGIIDTYLSGVRPKNPNPDLRSGEEQYAELQKNGGIIKIPDDKDDDDRWDKVAEKLKEYGKMFKEGLAKRDPKKIITGGIVVGLGVEMVICALTEANSEIIKGLLENVNKTVKYLYITKA